MYLKKIKDNLSIIMELIKGIIIGFSFGIIFMFVLIISWLIGGLFNKFSWLNFKKLWRLLE